MAIILRDDHTLRWWDISGRREVGAYTDIIDVLISPDGRLMATSSLENYIRIWDLPALREKARLTQPDAGLTVNTFSPDSGILATWVDERSVLWDVGTGQQMMAVDHGGDAAGAVAFSPMAGSLPLPGALVR